jgi:hypothetical protein
MIGLPVSSSSVQHRTSSVPPPSWPISRRHHVSQTHAATHTPGTVTESQKPRDHPAWDQGPWEISTSKVEIRTHGVVDPSVWVLWDFENQCRNGSVMLRRQISWRTWSCPRRTSASKNGGQCRLFEPATPFPFGPFASSNGSGDQGTCRRACRNPRVGLPPPL